MTPDFSRMNPDFNYKMELLAAFRSLECMRSRRDRDTLVTELELELRHPLSFPRRDDFRFDVWGLLGACLASPVPDALERFIMIIRAFEGDTSPVIHLVALVGDAPRQALPPTPIGLDQLLAGVEPDDLMAATRDAAGPLGPPTNLPVSDRVGLIQALSSATSMPDEPPPLLVFLVRLAARLPDQLAAELAPWIEWMAAEMRVPAAELDRIRATPGAGAGSPRSYIVVEVREDGPRPDRYLMSIWLQHDDGGGRALHVNDDRPAPLHELPAKLDEVLRALAQDSMEQIGDLTVEFVLPRNLLSHAVDQWPIVLNGLPHEIGTENLVVVRSLDRIRNPMVQSRWRRRWRQVRVAGAVAKAELVHWMWRGQIGYSGAAANVWALGDELPCIIVPFAANADPLPVEVAAGLDAGIPIMLWCRDRRGAEQFEAEIPIQMYSVGLVRLPAMVLRLRREAAKQNSIDHLGRHLSLLWDDPERLPPNSTFAAPAPV
jgi:hypothetical protein